MVDSERLLHVFFEDVYSHIEIWRRDVLKALQDPESASWSEAFESYEKVSSILARQEQVALLEPVLEELLRGFAHSMFTILDGGTRTAEVGSLSLVNAETGEPLASGAFHELFFDFLAQTDRL